jgi:hypothetical protein
MGSSACGGRDDTKVHDRLESGMSANPAIHRRPSGDVDIALPHDDGEPTRDVPPPAANNGVGDVGFSGSSAVAE